MSCCFIKILVFHFTFISFFYCHYCFILRVTKDISTLQYVTKIQYGTPSVPINLVVDLNGPFVWSDCSLCLTSSSHRPINFRSLHCSTGSTNGPGPDFGPGLGPICGLYLENSISRSTTWGDLVNEIMVVKYVDRSNLDLITTVDHRLLYYCTPTLFLEGLARGTKGMLGLGKTRMAIQSQLAMSYGLDRKFTICLSSSSSSDGYINIGGGSYTSDSKTRVSKLLTYTPLVSSQYEAEKGQYFINVKSLAINGRRILVPKVSHNVLRATLSTIVPYTTMESSIYDIFTKAYIDFATSINMTRVPPHQVVEPFSICFESKKMENTSVKITFPTIDLILQSEMVKWKITERNSMVRVNDDELACLGILDGGSRLRASIVIGGYQLEDNLLEFDVATSMLGFSSSILDRGFTCSNFKNYAEHT